MFDFRIITCPDGTQVIDPSLKTPYNSLTPAQMQEYMEINTRIAFMECLKRKAQRESDRKQGIRKKLFYKVACMIGLIVKNKKG